ncbi:MAG: dockerin type I repeat-containing protein [Oscillospiraceae bacterium]|nr:dockerin type I repeat-containing protein [Oscillospiraceae bacterium]
MKKNRMIAMLAAALCGMAAVTAPMPVTFVANASDIQYTTVAYDWPYYDDFNALMDKANCLFEGTVRSIHFENCNIGSQTTMLCTFYEIEVQKRYCDTVSNVVMLRVEGGIQDAYLTEQLALTDQIPLVVGMPVLRVGDKRLFALYQAEDADFASLLNPVQSIYQTGDSAALHRGISPAELLPDAAASYRVLDRDKHISYVTDAPLPDEVCTVKDHINDLMKRNKLPGSVWIYIKDGEMSVAAVCKNTSDWEILQAQVEQYGMPESAVPVIYDAIAYTCGDLNSDGTTNASDAANVLIAAANMGAGKDSGLTDAQFQAADFNFDGIVNASDAALILQQAAENGAKTVE